MMTIRDWLGIPEIESGGSRNNQNALSRTCENIWRIRPASRKPPRAAGWLFCAGVAVKLFRILR